LRTDARTAIPSVLVTALLVLGGVLLTLLVPPVHASLALGSCVTARSSSDSEEQSMLNLINDYRSRSGAPVLARSAALARAALWKSTDMAANHYFSHDDLIRGWSQRLSDCGYGPATTGENIADGHADAASTLMQWETSPPHNANLLNPNFHAVGLGRAEDASGLWYWTADFGGVADGDSVSSSVSTISSVAPAQTLAAGPVPTPPPLPTGAGSAIRAGMTAAVNAPGDCLRAHAAPAMAAAVQACIPDGTPVVIVGASIAADGYTWWPVFGYGWAVDAYLRPAN
jgi:uncharacterized protein YkwD